jgi:hypothetical protein
MNHRFNNIHAIENDLQTAMQLANTDHSGMNMFDRMKHHHVSGVSIAIVNNGAIEWAKKKRKFLA